MQKNKTWPKRIKLNNLLQHARLYQNEKTLSIQDKEIARWFLQERENYLLAIEKKKSRTQSLINMWENKCNNYVSGLLNKYDTLQMICIEVTIQIQKLQKLIV